jgi:hypothetical protein
VKVFKWCSVAALILICAVALYAAVVNGFLDFVGVSAPSNPASGNARVYYNSGTAKLSCLTSSGANCMPTGGGGGGSISSGTYAALPAPGNAGAMYLFTDSLYPFALDNGTSWDYFYNGSQVTPPPSTGWSWDQQSTSTVDYSKGYGWGQFTPPTSSIVLRTQYRTAPSTPYTLTARIVAVDTSGFFAGPSGAGDTGAAAVGWRDSGGKYITFRIDEESGNSYALYVDKWNSSTSFNAAYVSYGPASGVSPAVIRPTWYLRFNDDGTNLNVSFSLDGQHWSLWLTKSRTDFFPAGPNALFWGAYTNTDGVTYCLVDWTIS